MTQKELHLMKILSNKKEEVSEFVYSTVEGLTDDDVESLVKKNYVIVSIGDGFIGGVKTLELTPAGEEFIKTFCEVCECMPCDCDWGYN